jgi:hypothetical protein
MGGRFPGHRRRRIYRTVKLSNSITGEMAKRNDISTEPIGGSLAAEHAHSVGDAVGIGLDSATASNGVQSGKIQEDKIARLCDNCYPRSVAPIDMSNSYAPKEKVRVESIRGWHRDAKPKTNS